MMTLDVFNILKSFPKGTAAGLSGLQVQYLIDAAPIPLLTPICSLLRRVINVLVSGKVPHAGCFSLFWWVLDSAQ